MKRRPSPAQNGHQSRVRVSRDKGQLKPQRQAPLARRVALFLVGREVIYKDKGYLGPARVTEVSCNRAWIRVTMKTRPWKPERPSATFSIQCPANSAQADGLRISINAGYGINGIFIHARTGIAAMQALSKRGASLQELLNAMNHGRGLPQEVTKLRRHPFRGNPRNTLVKLKRFAAGEAGLGGGDLDLLGFRSSEC